MGLMFAFALAVAADEQAELGKVVPELTIKDLSGKELKLSDFRKTDKADGKVVVVVFWSYKCPSGNAILGDLKTLAEKCEKEGVVLVNVCAYGESQEQIKKFSDDNGIKYTLCFDEGKKGAKLFNAKLVTSSYVLDKEGKLVYRGAYQKVWDAAAATLKGEPVKENDTKAKG